MFLWTPGFGMLTAPDAFIGSIPVARIRPSVSLLFGWFFRFLAVVRSGRAAQFLPAEQPLRNRHWPVLSHQDARSIDSSDSRRAAAGTSLRADQPFAPQ